MKASGNKPPMTVASKGMYMQRDLLRNAEYFKIDLKLIEVIKVSALQVMF